MTSAANWSYGTPLTVWPVTVDANGAPTYGAPFIILGTYGAGGEVLTDENGTEFVSRGSFFFEQGASNPAREDYIASGDHTGIANPLSAGAARVRKLSIWDPSMFPGEAPDMVAYT